MKIERQFLQTDLFAKHYRAQEYFCPDFDKIKTWVEAGALLEFFSYRKKTEDDKKLLYLNTLNEQSFSMLSKLMIEGVFVPDFFALNTVQFLNNKYSEQIQKLLIEKESVVLDMSRFFKLSKANNLTIVNYNSDFSSLKCPLFNVLLARGAGLKNFEDNEQLTKIFETSLSLQHGVKIYRNSP